MGLTVDVEGAQWPPRAISQDRVFLTASAAIVLDGASAFARVDVSVETYVDTLGELITDALRHDPAGDLIDVLATAIDGTARRLDLRAGTSPSSTVAIVRVGSGDLDVLVLGDTAVHFGLGDTAHQLVDLRQDGLATDERRRYEAHLAAGHGYDDALMALLVELQLEQRKHRNRPGGYWIAEANPDAARHALTHREPLRDGLWAVAATDGSYGVLEHLGEDDWPAIASASAADILGRLHYCADWELSTDPRGVAFPRAKVSDDKAVATVRVRLMEADADPRTEPGASAG